MTQAGEPGTVGGVSSPVLADELMPRPRCPLCGGAGELCYEGLTDRIYGAAGTWNLRRCANAACGAMWLDPVWKPEHIGKAYAKYYTHKPAGAGESALRRFVGWVQRHYLGFWWGYGARWSPIVRGPAAMLPLLHPGLKAYLDFSVMYLRGEKRGRLLDIGCGNGDALLRMRALGWQVEGVEVDGDAVEHARERGLTVHRGDVAGAALVEGSFDAITISHVIEHVYDPSALLARCMALLKPGGVVSVVTPNIDARLRKKVGQHWLALDPPRHLVLFTGRSLRSTAEAAGFRDISVWTTVRETNVQWIAAQMIRRKGRYAWGDPGPMGDRLRGQWEQYLEPLLVCLGLAEGEELAMICRKSEV